jgi:hypothetical protein
MGSHTMAIVYATVLFFVAAFGGVMLLGTQRAVGARVLAFLLFCAVCILVTSWSTNQWRLLMGEAAVAWVVALLTLGAVMVIARVLRTRSTSSRQ